MSTEDLVTLDQDVFAQYMNVAYEARKTIGDGTASARMRFMVHELDAALDRHFRECTPQMEA